MSDAVLANNDKGSFSRVSDWRLEVCSVACEEGLLLWLSSVFFVLTSGLDGAGTSE
jgi:hypothetical protein